MCTSLIRGYRSRENAQKVFTQRKGYYDLPATIPCGQCMECRLKHSREKAIQCAHEGSLYDRNTVVTLTYATENLPARGSLQPEHAVKFMKDVRAMEQYKAAKTGGTPPAIKTYGCAEYGEERGRPHYHIILFNYDFEDKIEHNPGNCRVCKQQNHRCPGPGYYGSDILTEKWGRGDTQLMDLTFESAAYVARYITKKLTGPRAIEYNGKLPEQVICGTQKGIGKEWYKEWKQEIYKGDLVYRNTKDGKRFPMAPPKYYDRRYEIDNEQEYYWIKRQRKLKNKIRNEKIENEIQKNNFTNAFNKGIAERDRARIQCNEEKYRLLKRGYENDT